MCGTRPFFGGSGHRDLAQTRPTVLKMPRASSASPKEERLRPQAKNQAPPRRVRAWGTPPVAWGCLSRCTSTDHLPSQDTTDQIRVKSEYTCKKVSRCVVLSMQWSILNHDISCPPVEIKRSNLWIDSSDLWFLFWLWEKRYYSTRYELGALNNQAPQ